MNLTENGFLPDLFIRARIRSRLRKQLLAQDCGTVERNQTALMKLVHNIQTESLVVDDDRPVDLFIQTAPVEFFQNVLGRHLNYSCNLYSQNETHLDQAEQAMLDLICDRAQLKNGQKILELGGGWGALSLSLAKKYPDIEIVSLCHSTAQCNFIQARAQEEGHLNLKVMVGDLNGFEPVSKDFDRVISVEIPQNLRNYRLLLHKVSGWLNPGGKFFIQLNCHQRFSYFFESEKGTDWIGKCLFATNMIPSKDLLLYFQNHLQCEDHWVIGGEHYSKTCEDWLERSDQNRDQLLPILQRAYPDNRSALESWRRWRIYFMARSEAFAYRQGKEWYVSQYLFKPVR